ncbi:hypothetical protein [Streptomyces sp. A0958]|uniref:hypothetical protein n=1 Tax=Streptomyces sp. A0958 TaxID=2563101 RepID=UPI001F108C88|nr:hypothetical protein [Streptomyces sp. A0958]
MSGHRPFPVRGIRIGERPAGGLGIDEVRAHVRVVLEPRIVLGDSGPYDVGRGGPDGVELGLDGRCSDRPGQQEVRELVGPSINSRSACVRSSSRSTSRARTTHSS